MIFNHSNQAIFSSYLSDKFIRANVGLSLLMNAGLWIWLGMQFRNFPDFMPLHYNIYFGIDLIGPWYKIFFLPSLALAFLAINFLFGWFAYYQERIIAFFLIGAASLVQLISVLATVSVIIINQ